MKYQLFTNNFFSYIKAWLEIVKKEREEEDRKRQKEEKERRRIAQERKWIKAFLEAAFDGELDEIKKILAEVSICCVKSYYSVPVKECIQ